MSLVSFTPITDGSTSAAAQVNTPLSTLYNDYNGNITDANIAAAAAIAGSKIAAGTIANNTLLSPALGLAAAYDATNGVKTYTASSTNTSCSGYYINLGGIKMCWGITNAIAVSGTGYQNTSCQILLPSSFFTTIQSLNLGTTTITATQYMGVAGNGYSTANVSFYVTQLGSGSNGTAIVSWFVVGT